jgi:hypothetical protein
MHRPRVRLALVVLLIGLAGCRTETTTHAPGAWGSRVATPAPAVAAAQPVVARRLGFVTLLPISPKGATLGVTYGYEMPHCGVLSPIDVDASFWDAVAVPDTSVDFDGQPGSFRLDSEDRATFTATDGERLQLTRHAGAKEFPLCA